MLTFTINANYNVLSRISNFQQIFNTKMKRLMLKLSISGLLIFLINDISYPASVDIEVNTGLSYDTNVSQSFNTSKADTYFTLAPKANLKMPFNRTYFSTDLRAALERHINETSQDLQELVFSGLGRYNYSDFLSLALKDDFIVSGDLKSAEKLTDVTNKRKFLDNKLTSGIKFEIKPQSLIVSMEYTNSIRNYMNTIENDWMGHSGHASVEYIIGHRTSVQLGVGLVRKSYKSDVDYYSFPISASIKRNLSSKIDASFSLGIENRQYNKIMENLSWSKPTVALDIVGRFTPKTDSRLVLQRKVYDSDLFTGYSFVSNAVDTALAIDLKYNLQLILQGLYSRDNYIDIHRSDDVFGGKSAIRYNLSKWGGIVFGYGYIRQAIRNSDTTYEQHIVDIYYIVVF